MTERELNILRGKAMVGRTTPSDTLAVLDHLALLESELDKADDDDLLGPEGWRKWACLPGAD